MSPKKILIVLIVIVGLTPMRAPADNMAKEIGVGVSKAMIQTAIKNFITRRVDRSLPMTLQLPKTLQVNGFASSAFLLHGMFFSAVGVLNGETNQVKLLSAANGVATYLNAVYPVAGPISTFAVLVVNVTIAQLEQEHQRRMSEIDAEINRANAAHAGNINAMARSEIVYLREQIAMVQDLEKSVNLGSVLYEAGCKDLNALATIQDIDNCIVLKMHADTLYEQYVFTKENLLKAPTRFLKIEDLLQGAGINFDTMNAELAENKVKLSRLRVDQARLLSEYSKKSTEITNKLIAQQSSDEQVDVARRCHSELQDLNAEAVLAVLKKVVGPSSEIGNLRDRMNSFRAGPCWVVSFEHPSLVNIGRLFNSAKLQFDRLQSRLGPDLVRDTLVDE